MIFHRRNHNYSRLRRNVDDVEYNRFRNEVKKRDKYCQMPNCGSTKKCQVHHIERWADAVYMRYDPKNGILLCKECHKMIKNKEGYYTQLFINIVLRKYNKMIIIQDTREQQPWDFSSYDGYSGLIIKTLRTGDYQILGREEKLVIDRKKTPSELATNLGSKYNTFRKELIRMLSFERAFFICEFSLIDLMDFPNNASAKFKKYIKMTGSIMIKKIPVIEKKYNVKFLFCNNREEAQEKAIELFRNI